MGILSVLVMLIGYSTIFVITIRSNANPPMDENNPDNVFALLSYLNREQYGDRPLVYGQSFNAELDEQEPAVRRPADGERLAPVGSRREQQFRRSAPVGRFDVGAGQRIVAD